MGFIKTLQGWLQTRPLPDDPESDRRVEAMRRSLRMVPWINCMYRCYDSDPITKALIKQNMTKYLETVVHGIPEDSNGPSEEYQRMEAHARYLVTTLAQHKHSPHLKLREWAAISECLQSDPEAMDVMFAHGIIFDDPRILQMIRMCFNWTATNCLPYKVFLKPIDA